MTRFQPQWLQAGSYSGSQDRRLIGALWPGPASTGFAVTPASAMILNIAAGQGAVPTANNTGSVLCTSDAVEQITLTPAPPSGSNRYDLVILRPRGADLDGGANNDFIFDQVTGTVGGAVPATPAGTLPLASVFIPGGSASINGANIADLRPGLLAIGASALPPPVAPGSAIQSFTDNRGVVWVAKGGVNGGAWKRARDVLSAKWFRSAAWTLSTSRVVLAMDAMERDPYGLWVAGQSGYVVPIPGRWQGNFQVAAVATTTGQYLQSAISKNGTMQRAFSGFASLATTLYATAIETLLLAAGDVLTMGIVGNVALAGATTNLLTCMTLDYLGTG